MANEVVDKIVPHLSEDTRASVKQPRTHRLMLGGWADKSDFLTLTATISAAARKNSLEPATIEHLIASYGKDAMSVVEIVEKEPSLSSRICPNYPQIMAEVRFWCFKRMGGNCTGPYSLATYAIGYRKSEGMFRSVPESCNAGAESVGMGQCSN